MTRRPSLWLILCLAGALALPAARAVILYRTDDPAANTTPPGLAFPHRGWDYEGAFGGVLATVIAPNFIITAKHVGASANFLFQGTVYPIVQGYADPVGDLQIWKINGTLPYFAPLYSRKDETGKQMVALGRGTRRGSLLEIDGLPKGWNWGTGDGAMRWGENIIAGTFQYGAGNDLLIIDFNQDGLPEECHLSSGDSGGAAFIEDLGGVPKLAGINFGVDGPFYTAPDGNTAFNGGALRRARLLLQ